MQTLEGWPWLAQQKALEFGQEFFVPAQPRQMRDGDGDQEEE